MSITDFLLARIAEDEAVAQAAIDTQAPDDWENPTQTQNHWPANIAFWGRNTPARVLAECAAKRATVELHQALGESGYPDAGLAWEATKTALKNLAAIYADHPDYQTEWKVGP